MKPDDPVIAISAIEHFVYCPRQCALIHCDGVWTDNVHTVQGSRAHRRVDSGQHRQERGRMVLRAIPLWSEALGLSGRADAVEIQSGVVRPVEYKSGTRHGLAADLYGGPRRRIRVEFTAALRTEVRHAVDQIRLQILSGALPEAPNDQRCAACQLQHHCLPGITSEVQRVSSYVRNVVFECAT